VPSESILSTATVAHRCAQAMARYRLRKKHDPLHCYELFRRALVHRDEEAWTAIYEQYHRLVRHWLGTGSEDPDGLVNQSFERLWRALPPERFADFPSLDAILTFLKRCAQNLAIDASRREERKRIREASAGWLQEAGRGGAPSSPAEQALEAIVAEQLHGRIMDSLNDAQERLVVQASFEWNLKPRTIAERWPNLFADAREVSRVKERVLRRLQRDKELRKMIGTDREDGGET
jgi:DNA-directed RNA polymerase specialized sigma24 family protein